MVPLRLKVKRSLEKTAPDVAEFLSGRAPSFVYGGEVRDLPVFTFHAVDDSFEEVLSFLQQGGYQTVGAQTLEAYAHGAWKPDGRTVAITFDDGHISLTRVAVPLLAAYGFRALAFVVSGFVPLESTEDLSGWDALSDAVSRGLVEVGSHSLHHHQVPVGPAIVGFVTPSTPTDFAANIPIPRLHGDDDVGLGYPILRGRPRYLAQRAFRPDPEAIRRCTAAVASGGPDFFEQRHWARRLARAARITGSYEERQEADDAVPDDVGQSIRLIERHCPNPAARHLCYPWYARNARCDRLAKLGGASVVYGGIGTRTRRGGSGRPHHIRRLPPDFLWRLPGPQRLPLASLVGRRLRQVVSGAARLARI
jgi:hypothetical protein